MCSSDWCDRRSAARTPGTEPATRSRHRRQEFLVRAVLRVMNAAPEIHPDLRGVAKVLPRKPITPRRIEQVRKLQATGERVGAVVRKVLRRPSTVEVVQLGEISLRLHRPPVGTAIPSPAVLWIHGGGYVIGSAAQDDA